MADIDYEVSVRRFGKIHEVYEYISAKHIVIPLLLCERRVFRVFFTDKGGEYGLTSGTGADNPTAVCYPIPATNARHS